MDSIPKRALEQTRERLARKSYDDWADDVWAQSRTAFAEFMELAQAAREQGAVAVQMEKPFGFSVTFK